MVVSHSSENFNQSKKKLVLCINFDQNIYIFRATPWFFCIFFGTNYSCTLLTTISGATELFNQCRPHKKLCALFSKATLAYLCLINETTEKFQLLLDSELVTG
eukprot:TRINITY_DN8829_c0_g1_i2.p2 TRINITY_DN8829_c0_g1~~TRINITY_DN8829_c0_g1_i2.p2  ORF type:complete len:103 (+),score=4.20 TRINITY_DN8829_c0_g1_i2:3-311(+)